MSDILERNEVLDYAGWLIGRDTTALATGLPLWDGACDETGGLGLANWWYVVIGGASNAGKTQFMLYLARRASECGLNPGVITMEVPKRGLQRRVYSTLSSFGYYDFLPHKWDAMNAVKLADDITEFRQPQSGMPRTMTVWEHERAPTLDDIMGAAEALYDAGCRALFLDHLQLIKAPADQIADRATEISEALRWFAHGKKCLIVALSQLNRMASRERQKRPTMHDLWGGTAIESNANQVVLVDHSFQVREIDRPHLLRTFVYLDKNREGPNRVLIPVEVNFKTGLWREAQDHELGAWPME